MMVPDSRPRPVAAVGRSRLNMVWNDGILRGGGWLLLGLALLFTLFPIVWLAFTSLKTPRDIFAARPQWIFTPTLANYAYSFQQNQVGLYLFNSAVVSLTAMAIGLVLGSLGAYGFLRFRVPGGNLLFFLVLATRMVPHIVLIVPLFLMLQRLGILDTRFGLILVYTALDIPLVMWIMHGFFTDFPWELEDAARIDGSSRPGFFFRVLLPLSQPGLAAVAVFTFIANWNEFIMALVLTSTRQPRTMPVALALFNTEFGVRWDYLSAAGMLLILPTLLFTFLMQKFIVRGLTFGAVKS
jgi:multiple sugar transport system permease protein